MHAETNDELRAYFTQSVPPRVAVAVEPFGPSRAHFKKSTEFAADLLALFGGVFEAVERGRPADKSVRELCCELHQEGFTSLFLVQETNRGPTHVLLVALPFGPSAFFRAYELDLRSALKGAAKPSAVPPEVIMTNFTTRVGRRVGRLLQQQLSRAELLRARQVVTFHNQRDHIFFRAFRYVFDERPDAELKADLADKVAVRMQELGPRFSLKLRWVQRGVYDPQYEEYEFWQNATLESQNRTLFFL